MRTHDQTLKAHIQEQAKEFECMKRQLFQPVVLNPMELNCEQKSFAAGKITRIIKGD
jgi:hypothetical protein